MHQLSKVSKVSHMDQKHFLLVLFHLNVNFYLTGHPLQTHARLKYDFFWLHTSTTERKQYANNLVFILSFLKTLPNYYN